MAKILRVKLKNNRTNLVAQNSQSQYLEKNENFKFTRPLCHRDVGDCKKENLEYVINLVIVATTISHSFICLNGRFIKY